MLFNSFFRSKPASFFVIAFLLISNLSLVFSQSSSRPPVCETPPSRIPQGQRGRIFFFSASAPLANVLNKNESYVNSTELVLRHFKNIDYYTGEKITNGNINSSSSKSITCGLTSKWLSASTGVAKTNGWNATTPNCFSDLFYVPRTNVSSHYSADDLYKALKNRVEVGRSLSKVLVNDGVLNWSEESITFRGNDSVVLQNIKCSLYFTAGYRVNGNWYMTSSVSNHPQNHWVPDGKRHIIIEYFRAVPKEPESKRFKLVSTNLTLPVNSASDQPHCVRNDATTRWVIRSGKSSVSAFMFVSAEAIEVIPDALDKAELTIHHASDALFWSNIAIIALPLLLNLVPVSLITNVKSRRALTYLVLPRVVSALPMLIKGVEIILISKKSFTSVLTRIGVGATKKDVVAAETWAAKCSVRENIAIKGVYFVVTAILSVFLGLFIEYIANRYARKKYVDFLFLHAVSPQIRSEYYRRSLLKDIDLEYEMANSDRVSSE